MLPIVVPVEILTRKFEPMILLACFTERVKI